jgi:hypothetical protein
MIVAASNLGKRQDAGTMALLDVYSCLVESAPDGHAPHVAVPIDRGPPIEQGHRPGPRFP